MIKQRSGTGFKNENSEIYFPRSTAWNEEIQNINLYVYRVTNDKLLRWMRIDQELLKTIKKKKGEIVEKKDPWKETNLMMNLMDIKYLYLI